MSGVGGDDVVAWAPFATSAVRTQRPDLPMRSSEIKGRTPWGKR